MNSLLHGKKSLCQIDPFATQIQFKSNKTHAAKSQVPQLSNSYNMMEEDKSVIKV